MNKTDLFAIGLTETARWVRSPDAESAKEQWKSSGYEFGSSNPEARTVLRSSSEVQQNIPASGKKPTGKRSENRTEPALARLGTTAEIRLRHCF